MHLFAALLTPFDAHGNVDTAAINAHIGWLKSEGLDGVVPCGTTGEGPSLSVAERQQVIDAALTHNHGLRVIGGTGCANLPETIALTRYALERGCESALVAPPFFYKNPSEAGLIAYYRAVCDALPAGGKIMLYHIPPQTQVPITTRVIDALLESHPNAIIGIKDSGQDDDYTAMLSGHYPQLAIYDGTAPLYANCLADGAAGGIFALANLFPRQLRAIMDAVAANTNTIPAQERVTKIEQAMRPVIPALKALLPRVAGLPSSPVRPPLVAYTEAEADAAWAKIEPLISPI